MYSTLLLTLMATTPMAPGQYFGAYGNYGGSYGAYGAYGGGYALPYYCYPYIQGGQVVEPDNSKANEEREEAERKFNELQSSYGKMEQRLHGLERLLTTMEPYLKAQETVHDERYKALDVKLEARLAAIEKLQAFAGLEGQVTLGMAKLEERLHNFEAKLRTNNDIPDSLLAKLDALGQTTLTIDNRLSKLETSPVVPPAPALNADLADLQSRLLKLESTPTLPVASDSNTQEVKTMISGVEEKLGLGLNLLEEKLRHMEDRLHKQNVANSTNVTVPVAPTNPLVPLPNDPVATGNAGNTAVTDAINQIGRTMEQRFALLEERIRQSEDYNKKIYGVERDVLNHNFEKLRDTIKPQPQAQPVKTQVVQEEIRRDEAHRRVNRAVVIITLPADAKLFINGMESTIGSNLRTFVTPELEVSKHYYYTIKVELTRNGQTVTDTQRVYFQRGEEVRVTFDHLEVGTGMGPALPSPKNG